MKRVGIIAVWLAGGLVLSAGARADTVAPANTVAPTNNVALADNPYTAIVTRNLFGLNPVVASDEPVGDPPPKITLNGIMSISGHLQALYKVAGIAKPGEPAKDQSYILSEGQREDDIEVTHINDKDNLVTFNNHGTVQEIPLANAPKSALSAPAGPTSGPGRPGPGLLPGPRGGRNGGNGGTGMSVPGTLPGRGPGAGRPNRGTGNDANQNPVPPPAAGGGLTLNSMQSAQPSLSGNADQQQAQNNLTPEENATLLEVQREMYQSQNNPMHGLLPPTRFTAPDATGPTGNPLVIPGPGVPPPVTPAK
ncbi:MAG: hypothetical protein WBN75_13745 [Verrucomicrobiia bacterium]